MIMVKDDRFSIRNQRQTKQDEKCGQLSAILAFLTFILVFIMLSLALTTEFSEQKTVFYMITVLSGLGCCALIGTSIFLLKRAHEANELKKSYINRHINLSRFTSQQFLTESQVSRNIY